MTKCKFMCWRYQLCALFSTFNEICCHNLPRKFYSPDIGPSISRPSSQEGRGPWLVQIHFGMKSNLICILFLAEHLNFVPTFAALSLNTGITARQVRHAATQDFVGQSHNFPIWIFPRSSTTLKYRASNTSSDRTNTSEKQEQLCKKKLADLAQLMRGCIVITMF